MTTLPTKHQRLAALRPLSPESVASLAAAWDVRMVHESNAIEETEERFAPRQKTEDQTLPHPFPAYSPHNPKPPSCL